MIENHDSNYVQLQSVGVGSRYIYALYTHKLQIYSDKEVLSMINSLLIE